MCRQNQLFGWILIAFGIGLLIGVGLESGFWTCVLALASVILGFWVMKKK